ncbi:Uncharacterised protein [Serratia marcescens]|nr:Uncharacterised protein [Serratia marcescens]CVA74155.1 Uncharacterised protein [Serratia marcescens]CVB13462.1 Uncharacterised protein [Serratia marcescens]CVC14148.1 Uncharacterised protein [Serratia marcescens]CVC66102.1 Uncharacterised protein [Serratia marcescens]
MQIAVAVAKAHAVLRQRLVQRIDIRRRAAQAERRHVRRAVAPVALGQHLAATAAGILLAVAVFDHPLLAVGEATHHVTLANHQWLGHGDITHLHAGRRQGAPVLQQGGAGDHRDVTGGRHQHLTADAMIPPQGSQLGVQRGGKAARVAAAEQRVGQTAPRQEVGSIAGARVRIARWPFVGLQHHVHIGAAEAERGDPGDQRTLAAERHRLGGDDGVEAVQIDVRVQRAEVHVARRLAVAQHFHRLDQADDPGGPFQVADVGLHRSQHHRLAAVAAQHVLQGAHLDRIAQRRAGAMAFDVVHVLAAQPGFRQRPRDDGLLRQPIRRRHGYAASVLVHRRSADHRQNSVTVGLRVAEALQHHRACAFATAIAVRRLIKCGASPLRRQCLGRTGADKHSVMQHYVYAADQRHRTNALAQFVNRQIDRHQRRRTGGINSDAGASQP